MTDEEKQLPGPGGGGAGVPCGASSFVSAKMACGYPQHFFPPKLLLLLLRSIHPRKKSVSCRRNENSFHTSPTLPSPQLPTPRALSGEEKDTRNSLLKLPPNKPTPTTPPPKTHSPPNSLSLSLSHLVSHPEIIVTENPVRGHADVHHPHDHRKCHHVQYQVTQSG